MTLKNLKLLTIFSFLIIFLPGKVFTLPIFMNLFIAIIMLGDEILNSSLTFTYESIFLIYYILSIVIGIIFYLSKKIKLNIIAEILFTLPFLYNVFRLEAKLNLFFWFQVLVHYGLVFWYFRYVYKNNLTKYTPKRKKLV